jgi:hypothetical protein
MRVDGGRVNMGLLHPFTMAGKGPLLYLLDYNTVGL